MEIELLDDELDELARIKAECIRKVIYCVEWHWELTGEQIPFEFIVDKINEQMEREWLIYDAVSVFYEDCEVAYIDICDDLFDS